MEMLALLGVVIGVWIWRQRRRRTAARRFLDEPWAGRQYVARGPDDRPDNPRFPTWDAAFNRIVTDDLRFRIEYADADGEITEREITPRSIHIVKNSPEVYIRAHCHLRGEDRTFRSDRILQARNAATGREIIDLGQYLRRKY